MMPPLPTLVLQDMTAMDIVYLDFETRSTVDLKKTGLHKYASDSSTEIMCMGYAFGDEAVELWIPKQGLRSLEKLTKHIEAGKTVVAHNAAFEIAIWNSCLGCLGLPEIKIHQVTCTMAMSYAMALPGSLEGAAAGAGIKKQKDLAGGRIMLQLSKPKSILGGEVVWHEDPEKYKRMYEYCKQDVEVERELFKRLLKLSDREREVWELDFEINNRGVYVDREAIEAANELIEFEKVRLTKRIQEVSGNQIATPNAITQMANYLRSRGVYVEDLGKASVTELLKKDLPSDCREILLIRQEAAKASTAKLDSILGSVAHDGRIRGLFQYHGAGTGRWAGRRVQLQNLPRPNLKQDEIENVIETIRRIK